MTRALHAGVAIHIYPRNRFDDRRVFFNADGELLIVPQLGRLLLRTEIGLIEAGPGEIAVMPRGVKFRVELLDGHARGYVCENYGALFRLPELGPDRRNGLANPRDFQTPVGGLRGPRRPFEVRREIPGRSVDARRIDHSPLDVVAWHGNYAPYKYDLARFNCHQARSASIILTRRSSPC